MDTCAWLGIPYGIVANILDCSIIVSLNSSCPIEFALILTLLENMNPFIPLALLAGVVEYTNCTSVKE